MAITSKKRWPDFMVIGAAKSGTSSFYDYLCRHPKIYMPPLKEPQFFSNDSVFARGPDWYKNLFIAANEDQLVGEASTTYSRWPHTMDSPELIHRAIPNAKFIYIMRHPIDRAFSHYVHHMRAGITMTFEEALRKNSIYVDCSMYITQIERYLQYFPRDQFLFLFQTELQENPSELFKKVLSFLKVEQIDLTASGIVKRNVGGPDHFIRASTTCRLRKIPFVSSITAQLPKSTREKMFNLLRQSFVGKKIQSRYKLQPMKHETRAHLVNVFAQPNRKLEEFLEIELPGWQE
jgi:hypothetical protein